MIYLGQNPVGVTRDLPNTSIIDDTAGNGDTDVVWSADKSYDELQKKYEKPNSGIPASDIESGVIPVLTDLIDDTAGNGDTTKVWSADKSYDQLNELTSALNDKTDKVTGATSGNFAGLDSNGNLTDSGSKASDFGTYSKPSGGIPKTDLASEVQTSLDLADTALQGDDVATAVDAWLDENITNPDSPPLDRYLTSYSAAAPADIVGNLQYATNYIRNTAANSVDVSSQSGDLDVTDTSGNVLARFESGNIETKNFDSKAAAKSVPVSGTDSDLDMVDEFGNVILRIQNGYLKTKKVDTTDPYELPDYYKTHLDNKTYRINNLMQKTGGDTFIFCTDQHMMSNSHQSFKLIRQIHLRCRVNKLFMGGDLINGIYEPWAKEFRDAMDGRCYFMAGNHDYMRSTTTEENIAYSLTSALDDEVSGDPMRRYYWIDNPNQKIRYICTNSFKSNSAHTSWDWGFEEAQMTWLTETAMDVPAGWGCIIMSHMFWNGISESTAGVVLPGDGTGNPWDGDMKAVLDAIDAANTNNQVIAIVQGHTHQDAIKATDGGIPILIVTADRHNFNDGDEPYMDCRVPGTVKEQAFDVCIVDRVNRKLYAVRVGGYNTGDAEEEAALETAGERVIDF